MTFVFFWRQFNTCIAEDLKSFSAWQKKQGGDWILIHFANSQPHDQSVTVRHIYNFCCFLLKFFFFWKGGRDIATLQMKCQHCLNWSLWQILMQYIHVMAQAMSGRGWAPMCHHYDRWFLNILNVNGFVAKALKIVCLMYLFDSIC